MSVPRAFNSIQVKIKNIFDFSLSYFKCLLLNIRP